MRRGVIVAGLALCIGLAATEMGAVRSFGWLIALPLTVSAYLLISGTFGICIFHGIKGNRGADHGQEAVLDEESRSRMRGRALLAVSGSVLIACLLTAAFVASS